MTRIAATIAAPALERWTRDLLAAAGLEAGAAATVAETLVEASLRGVDSHGVARVPIYAARLRAGTLNGRPRPRTLRSDGAVALIDGDQGPGQVAAVLATDLSVALAREHGVGVALVRRSGHFGAAAYYVMRAARAGLVAIAMTNTEPLVAPYGGVEPAIGTNPIALAAPTRGGVFNLDLATSQVAMNRIFNARDEGRPIPLGWGIDEHGRPTTDAAAVGAGLPLGGYKGYALALLVEILCGVLPGAGVAHGVGPLYGEDARPQDVGHFHLALDVERTIGRDRFEVLLDDLLTALRQARPAPGHEEVLVPGDPEDRARAERERSGVPVEPALWATLLALGEELGVAPPPRPM
jgi:ureidoglycolate dehydrogenase (NAD+)